MMRRQKKRLYFRHSERGFSLVELTATLVAALVFSMGAAVVVIQTKRIEVSSDFQATLDQTHIMAMQKLRNMSNLSQAMNIGTNPCFGKSGTNCTGAISPARGPVPPLILGNGEGNQNVCVGGGYSGTSSAANCFVAYSILYEAFCTADRCDRIEFTITTEPGGLATNKGLQGRTRTTKITIPGFMFANRTAINFSCSSNDPAAIPRTINYRDLTMTCGGVGEGTTARCALNMPASGFNGGEPTCQTGENRNCPTGVQVAGLFQGQTSCN